MVDDLLGRAFLHDVAALHKNHARGDLAGKADLVGDHDHRHTVGGKLLHNLQNLAHHFGVQGAGRLVKQQNIGVHRQGAGNRHALLLPARKLRRVGFGFFCQPHALQQAEGFLLGGGFVGLFQLHGRQHHIAQHVQIVEQIKMLKHHTDVFAHLVQVGFFVGHIVSVHDHGAGGDVLQPVQAAQKGRFAAAGRSQNDDDLALADIGGHVLEDLQTAEVFLQMLDVNFHVVLIHGHGSAPSPNALPDATAA